MRKSQEAKENQMREDQTNEGKWGNIEIEGQANDEGKWGNIADPNLGKIIMHELCDSLVLKMT